MGCDDNDSSKSYEQEEMVNLTKHSNIAYEDGDLGKVFHDSEFDVIPTTSTSISIQRSSCSGFDGGSLEDIGEKGIGTTCIIFFSNDQVDWTQSPSPVRPSKIEVYRDECILPETPENPCETNNPCGS